MAKGHRSQVKKERNELIEKLNIALRTNYFSK